MSDNWVKIIPADPTAVPRPESVAQVEQFLSTNYRSDEPIIGRISDQIEFRGCGGNFEKILCPNCERSLEEHWMGWMQESFAKSAYAERDFTVPCCGKKFDLNDLVYIWPQGFSRFEIALMNPGKDIPPAHLLHIESILGLPVKKIFLHL